MEEITESLEKCTISKRKTKLQISEEKYKPDENGFTKVITIQEIIADKDIT